MTQWIPVRTQADIDRLLAAAGGFHDTCLASLTYQSGAFVDRERRMCFGRPEERVLHAVFHSQWRPERLELRFRGVRQFSVAGWQESYCCDIFDCHLAFHPELSPDPDQPQLLWADGEGFSPSAARPPLAEPMDT